ncbi:hypothetical protein EON65_58925 [archaeon]|nr:MAG: hypothetical protein EON65_58925 [archaeon]
MDFAPNYIGTLLGSVLAVCTQVALAQLLAVCYSERQVHFIGIAWLFRHANLFHLLSVLSSDVRPLFK